MAGGGLRASGWASGVGVGTRLSGLRKPTLPQFPDKKCQRPQAPRKFGPSVLLRFRGQKAAWSWRLPSGQQTGCAHRDRPSRAAETDRLGPASASILGNKPGNHVEGRRKNNGKSRPGVRSIDAFLTNSELEDWLTPEGGSDPASSMVFTSDRSRLSNRQLYHKASTPMALAPTNGRQVRGGWRTSAPPCRQSRAPTNHRWPPREQRAFTTTTSVSGLVPAPKQKRDRHQRPSSFRGRKRRRKGKRGRKSSPEAARPTTYCRSNCSLPRRRGSGSTWAGLWP